MPERSKVVAIVSGGLDSTTMLHVLKDANFDIVQGVSFDYGQRHRKELEYAENNCLRLHIPWSLIDLSKSNLIELLARGKSSLLSAEPVPEGHYAEDNMKSTVVPNRNMMMISIAGAVAVALNANLVATGVHAGDHAIYPDCRPEFIGAVGRTLWLANNSMSELNSHGVLAPFLYRTKGDIAYDALRLGVPLHETWSCYKGGVIHCGRCGTCVERIEAINDALDKWNRQHASTKSDAFGELTDHTEYEDTEYWKEVVTAQ